jgi:heat shock protein HtpX
MASVVMFVANMLQWGAIFGIWRDKEGNGGGFSALLLAFIAPIAAGLIKFAISRSREYMADAGGAKISGKPQALASALQKLAAYSTQMRMKKESPATAHMFIVNPFSGKIGSLFSTHPPVEERVRRLMEMSRTPQ